MIEEILLFAIKFENCLPEVRNCPRTGWWPHYDVDYPDPDKKVWEGDVEVYNIVCEWLKFLDGYDVKVLWAYLDSGEKVSDFQAARKLNTTPYSLCGSYERALSKLKRRVGLENIKRVYTRYIL